MNQVLNYLDLFSGCGGFRLGLEVANVNLGKEFHSEIDKYASEVYARHFKQSENLGNVKTIKPVRGKINGTKINLITFGFPCQDLSIAGKGRGLEGNRSGLFYEATRLIRELKPEVFIFENVKGLLTNNKGKDFEAVLREIADIGLYECQWQLLNTRWFLPQNRERIYFIGFIRKKPRQQVFPIEEVGKIANERNKSICWKIQSNGKKESKNSKLPNGSDAQNGQDGRLYNRLCRIKSNTKKGYEEFSEGDSVNFSVPNSKTRRGRIGKGVAQTLDTQCNQAVYEKGIRRLTPLECERLQGFPDKWTDSASDTQRYKMLGNAVSVPVAEEIFKRIFSN